MNSIADPPAEESPARQVFSVSQLNREARALLEGGFPLIWVQGEISNLSRPASGHMYFSLKDTTAQVRATLFRNRATRLRFKPEDGLQVLAHARVSLYEARGDFQLIIEHLEEAGHGALQRAFEELKHKLAKAGWFDAARKKPVPRVPHSIGVITSPSAAALRDILSVIGRRYARARVILYPVPVQGEGSADRIAAMIRLASARAECDVLILARGGGSLEDLWAFNQETVAYAIHDCKIPIVSGVGHEIDFTIADFVADLRAPTPTAAAELVTPDSGEWLNTLAATRNALTRFFWRVLAHFGQRLDWCAGRLEQLHPARVLRERAQRLDELSTRLMQRQRADLRERAARLEQLRTQLHQHSPGRRLALLHHRNQMLGQRLTFASVQYARSVNNRLRLAVGALNAVSPLATLGRGYAIVTDAASGQVISSVNTVSPGQGIHARLADGGFSASVEAFTKGAGRK